MAFLQAAKIRVLKIVIVILIAVIVFQYFFNSKSPPPTTIVKFDTTEFLKSLEINYKKRSYVPKIKELKKKNIKINTTDNFFIQSPPIDSLEIFKKYYTVHIVIDTIANDSNAFIVVTDIIGQNRILKRTVFPNKIFPHYKIITKTVTKTIPQNMEVRLGLGLGVSRDRMGIMAKALITTKSNKTFGISYDILNNCIEGSIYWKLNLRPKRGALRDVLLK